MNIPYFMLITIILAFHVTLSYGARDDRMKSEFKQKFKNYASDTFLDKLISENTSLLGFKNRAELITKYCTERVIGSDGINLCTITILITTYESGLKHDEQMWKFPENISWWAQQGKRGIEERISWEEFNYKLSVTLPKLINQKGPNFQKALEQLTQTSDIGEIGDLENGAVQINDSAISEACNPKSISVMEEAVCKRVIRSMMIRKWISFPFASTVQEKFKTTPEWSNRMNAIVLANRYASMLKQIYFFKDVLKLTELGIEGNQNTDMQGKVLKNCDYVESEYCKKTEENKLIARNWCNLADSKEKRIKQCDNEIINLITDRDEIKNEIKQSTVADLTTIEKLKKVKSKSEIICFISGHHEKECLEFMDYIFLENKFVNMEDIIMTAFISRGTPYIISEIRKKLEKVKISTNEYPDVEKAISIFKTILLIDEKRQYSQRLDSDRINDVLQTCYQKGNQSYDEVKSTINSKYPAQSN